MTPGARPQSFAPSGGQSTLIHYQAATDASAIPAFTVTIKQGSTPIRTLTSTAGSSAVVWEGKDAAGTIQPAGTYTAEIAGQANQTVTLTRQVSHQYTYDRLYRLTWSDQSFGPTGYRYDPLGNRRSSANELTTTSYQYDRLDRLTQVGATNYTNDANGNRTGRGNDTFTYDQANRLTRAAISGGITTDYAYDGDGTRVCTDATCAVPHFTYDVNRGLPVLLKDSQREYVWGLGLAYSVSGSSIAVHHSDGLGSTRAVTTAAGLVESTYLTDDFGVSKLLRGANPARLQYTGEPRDAETGFVYLRARMYDPSVGRFLQRDPLPGLPRAPSSLNRHVYVMNNPIGATDHSGLCSDPNPGAAHVRFCIETFIPDATIGPFDGDNRGPRSDGGTYRTHQRLIQHGNGSYTFDHDIGDSSIGGGQSPVRRRGDVWGCGAVKSQALNSTGILAACTASNGLLPLLAPPIS
ncbi:MAG: RHS repeat-associated core domain-containing protein, partial [Chloroflexota bacterium]